MAGLSFRDPGTGQWTSVATIGPPGPQGPAGVDGVIGVDGATGPTGPTGPAGDAASGGPEEVIVGDVQPTDPGTDLWINTTSAATASAGGWAIFDTRYASRDPRRAANVDHIPTSGTWIINGNTKGKLPPRDGEQLVVAVVLSPTRQAQYSYDLSCDEADGVTPTYHRHKHGSGKWSPWVDITPRIND
jgi:hypothetical protein